MVAVGLVELIKEPMAKGFLVATGVLDGKVLYKDRFPSH